MHKLSEKIKDIPKSPGIYEFINKDGEIIYIGKAKNLKNRVSQYFSNHDNRPQLPYLLAEAVDIQYTVSSNELESLFLENTLIKKHLPKYNIQLRDDKNYAFITIDYSTEIPQIGYSRTLKTGATTTEHKKSLYFGPYSAAHKIRNTLNLIRKIFPFCSHKEIGKRPCFYYYLHRCPGVCIGKISLEEYNKHIHHITEFLSGDTGNIKKEIRTEMNKASHSRQYEYAGRLRDQLKALELLDEKQNAIIPKPVSWDVVSLSSESGFSCINLFKIRHGKMQGKENFVYELGGDKLHTSSDTEVLQKFLERYYLETNDIPKTIYTEYEPEDASFIIDIITSRFSKKTDLIIPYKSKPKELVTLGKINASEYLKNWLLAQAGHQDTAHQALIELQQVLKLPEIPNRIECYDISNTQGTNAVGSMAVFEQGLPAKSQYRKFKINYTPKNGGPDDFAMMQEMLTRRFSKSFDTDIPEKSKWPVPNLIVIDGGKGQLSSVLEVVHTFQTQGKKFNIPLIGLAKRIEEIFFPNNNTPLVLPHTNPGLKLLQRLRDETHRFGITFHRDIRSKQQTKSVLDEIPGIGPKTKKILKTKFGTVANIRSASFDELTKLVGAKLAEKIYKNI